MSRGRESLPPDRVSVPPEVADNPLNKLVGWMAQNPVAANVLMAILVVGGIGTLGASMKYEVFPEVELEKVLVTVAYPGASPEEVEQGVVLSIEEAVRGLDGVKEVRSYAYEGLATVAVDLLLGTDQDRALNDVKSAVDRITSFPGEAERPVVALATNRQPVLTVILHGDLEEHTLRDLAEHLRTELLARDGVTSAELGAVRPLEISIDVPEESLREYGLTLDDVANAIRAGSVDLPGGGVRTSGGEILVRTAERREAGSEFGDIVVRSTPDGQVLRVRDIATVVDGFEDQQYTARFNGEPAAMVNVSRVGRESPTSVSAAVQAYLDDFREELPEGVHATVWMDWSEMYDARIGLLQDNAVIGLILVLLILGMFLEPKLAFWVTLGIPISFVGSLLFLPGSDVSINMISVFGFIVTLGMVVDDAIVAGEAIHHRRQQGMPYMQAAIEGAKEVAVPVTFSVLTTCIAFAPMLFVPGIMGKFFRVIPIVVISVLLLSLVESLLVLPAHLSHPMSMWLRVVTWIFRFPMTLMGQKHVSRGLTTFVHRVYRPIVEATTRERWLTVGASLGIFILTIGLIAGGRVEFAFFPKIQGDMTMGILRMPVGTAFDVTAEGASRMEAEARAILAEYAERNGHRVDRGVRVEVGQMTTMDAAPERDAGNRASHYATAMIYLVDQAERDFTTKEFTDEWRERIGALPGAEQLTFTYNIGASPGAPIDVQLTHANPEELNRAAEALAVRLQEYDGVVDIDSGVAQGKRQIDFRLTAAGRARGLTAAGLARQVRGAYFGAEAVRQQRGRDEIRVYVRRPEEERQSLADIESMLIQLPGGGEMPLREAAELIEGRAYTVIRRIDARRTVVVTADIVEGRANANEVMRSVLANDVPALQEEFPGLSYTLGGEQQQQAETGAALGIGFIMALIAMFGMLAIVFRSYTQPFLVLSAIPFGIVGATIGHVVMGYELSLMSMIGVVALAGVVVNDSLVLIVAVNNYRDQGLSVYDAAVRGGVRRFRPILLTSLTTFFGLAPMILEQSAQARFLIPMAISLGFGVLFATVITLVLVPALYMAQHDILEFFAKITGGALSLPAEEVALAERGSLPPPDPANS